MVWWSLPWCCGCSTFSDCFTPFLPSVSEKDNEGKSAPTTHFSESQTRSCNPADICQGDPMKIKLLFAVAIVLSLSALAQTNSQTTAGVEPMAQTPTFHVVVTS